MLVASATMTATLDLLERRGWIRRIPNPGDRRSVLIEITPVEAEPAEAETADRDRPIVTLLADAPDDRWHEIATDLEPGAYRVTLRNVETTRSAASPVHDVFEVVAG